MTYKRYLKKYNLVDGMEAYRSYSKKDVKNMSEHDANFFIELTYPIRFGCKQMRVSQRILSFLIGV